MKPPYNFWNWATEITNKNRLLTANKRFADENLIDILESRLPLDIENRLRISRRSGLEISKTSTLSWMNDIKDIVNVYQNDIKRAREVADEAASRSTKRSRPFVSTSTNTATGTSATTARRTDRVPPLTASERALLAENEGCYKCRRFFVKHQSSSCPNGYPVAKDYHTLTSDMVVRARKVHVEPSTAAARAGSSAKVAAIISAPPSPEGNTVAAVINGNDSDIVNWATSSEDDEDAYVSDYRASHLHLKCLVHGSSHRTIVVNTFLDNGAYIVLIHPNLVRQLKLKIRKLPKPETFGAALHSSHSQKTCATEFVYLRISTMNGTWTSKKVIALISPSLHMPVLLGLPFLAKNKLVIDHDRRTCFVRGTNIDLLSSDTVPLQSNKLSIEKVNTATTQHLINTVIAKLELDDRLQKLEANLRIEFKHIFEPIPHADNLPTDVVARIKLKDPSKTITTRSYASPKKYKEAWAILIQRHLDAGRIRPSSSPFASPAFLTPKTDPTVLPRWVNDYRQLNANTVIDSHPLPRVDDILADCAKGKIWGVIDMTDSFFQTRLHPDDMPLTAITTPLGLYEWTVMPMGARNSPSVQQR